jgi:hypothetical protein
MSTLQVVPKREFTECLVCNTPLGQESRDLDFRVCHEHRKCIKCSLDVTPKEVRLAYDIVLENQGTIPQDLEIEHARCKILNHPTIEKDPTLSIKQTEYDLLNLIRLMVTPDLQLSSVTNENNAMIYSSRLVVDMTFDEKLLHMKMLQACVANVSIAVRQDPKYRKDALVEREKKHLEQAKQEQKTSQRPQGKSATDENEVYLAEFMRRFSIVDRKVAMKIKRDRDKAINALTELGIPLDLASKSVDADLCKRGLVKDVDASKEIK